MVCGAKLVYEPKPKERQCHYCGASKPAYIHCDEGHFVCDNCHGADFYPHLENLVLAEQTKDPLAITEKLLTQPNLPFLGGEHHSLVAAALLAALKNYGPFPVRDKLRQINDQDIIEGITRMKQIPSCTCAFQGACGAGIALGAVFSIIYGATCALDVERTLAMRSVIPALTAIANTGGPACCKQSVRVAVEVGAALLKEQLGVKLPLAGVKGCKFPKKNSHGCKGGRCKYFGA